MVRRHIPYILLIDNSPLYAQLLDLTLEQKQLRAFLEWIKTSDEALGRLTKLTYPEDFPDLILLDWNLKNEKASDFIDFIRNNPLSKNVPVVMLSTHLSRHQIISSYEHGANSYVIKEKEPEEISDQVIQLVFYWTKVNLI